MTEENLTSINNYCTNSGKSSKPLLTKDLSAKKLDIESCSKCGEQATTTHNYCNNCGAVKEEIRIKKGIKNLDIKVPDLNSTSQLDIMYILKAVGIISLIGLFTGIMIIAIGLREPLSFSRTWGLFSNDLIGNEFSVVFSMGLALFRFVSFIPINYGFGKLYLFNTLEFMEYGETISLAVAIMILYAIGMIVLMFVFGKKLATKYQDTYLIHAAAFSGIYSLVLCATVKGIFLQAFITVFAFSFISVIAGCKYIESKNNNYMEGM